MLNKKNKKIENILEKDFLPPDGGWGWIIILAVGFSNVSLLLLLFKMFFFYYG